MCRKESMPQSKEKFKRSEQICRALHPPLPGTGSRPKEFCACGARSATRIARASRRGRLELPDDAPNKKAADDPRPKEFCPALRGKALRARIACNFGATDSGLLLARQTKTAQTKVCAVFVAHLRILYPNFLRFPIRKALLFPFRPCNCM